MFVNAAKRTQGSSDSFMKMMSLFQKRESKSNAWCGGRLKKTPRINGISIHSKHKYRQANSQVLQLVCKTFFFFAN